MTNETLAAQYNQFQNDFGQDVGQDYENIIRRLFTPDLEKVANGNKLANERAQLLPQLNSVKDFAGAWSIQTIEIIPSADNTKYTNRYSLKSEKGGQFEIIAILSIREGQIHRIDEIYYQTQ